tara:strand:+ start:77 stop:304 length:228 start_codon:yes stop_codon:yes gene_type:complete
MTDDRELSDLKLDRKECPKCGALWLGGQHYWSGTGVKGNDLDLAGLVCNQLADSLVSILAEDKREEIRGKNDLKI